MTKNEKIKALTQALEISTTLLSDIIHLKDKDSLKETQIKLNKNLIKTISFSNK